MKTVLIIHPQNLILYLESQKQFRRFVRRNVVSFRDNIPGAAA